MQFVLPWGKGSAQYQEEYQDLETGRPERCPHCGCGKFHKWGKYERYIVEEGGEDRICIKRIRCIRCHRTYSYLPSFCLSGISYGLDFVMAFLKALLLKIKLSLGDLRRHAYVFLRRFVQSENLWLVFLRAKGFGDFPPGKRERITKIFAALLEFHKSGNLLAAFFQETGRHFLSAK